MTKPYPNLLETGDHALSCRHGRLPAAACFPFGGKLYQSVLINFVEEQPTSTILTDFQLFHDICGKPGTVDLDEVEGSRRVHSRLGARKQARDLAHQTWRRTPRSGNLPVTHERNVKVLQKNPPLEAGQDFYRLRRDGIGFIAQMGSGKWTDYNVHDPGITILEALCYAITDLTYRIGWDIEDILTPRVASSDPLRPYPNQAFFTAREILTVNPVTPDDFRRLLIDLDGVRNAWILCKDCACDASYFAWCDNDELTLSYAKPAIRRSSGGIAADQPALGRKRSGSAT